MYDLVSYNTNSEDEEKVKYLLAKAVFAFQYALLHCLTPILIGVFESLWTIISFLERFPHIIQIFNAAYIIINWME